MNLLYKISNFKMFTLATDVQKIIIEFLEPKEIKELYETCKDSKIMFEELTKHTNFIVDCKEIVADNIIKWFILKNIKLNLLETYENINGYQTWYKNGKIHRDNDLPARITLLGNQYWCKNGLQHRGNDLPATIYTNGTKFWFKNGLNHRDNDLPAIIYSDGTQIWYKNGIAYFPN